MKDRLLAVLGGMGPASTIHFLDLLVKMQQQNGAVQDEDFYPMMMYSVPMTEWDNTGFVDKNAVKGQLERAFAKLVPLWPDVVAIPCNTIHYFYDELSLFGLPIVNMVEETVKEVVKREIPQVGLLCSRSTRDLCIYDKYVDGTELIKCNDSEQEVVDNIILDVQRGDHHDLCWELLRQVVERMSQRKEINTVILGCTELSIVGKGIAVEVVDSSEVLARTTLERLK